MNSTIQRDSKYNGFFFATMLLSMVITTLRTLLVDIGVMKFEDRVLLAVFGFIREGLYFCAGWCAARAVWRRS